MLHPTEVSHHLFLFIIRVAPIANGKREVMTTTTLLDYFTNLTKIGSGRIVKFCIVHHFAIETTLVFQELFNCDICVSEIVHQKEGYISSRVFSIRMFFLQELPCLPVATYTRMTSVSGGIPSH